jgi:hypothetical protein
MVTLMNAMTKESIEKLVGREIDDVTFTLAQNSALGVEESQLALILGCPEEDVRELMRTQEYKDVRLVLGAQYAQTLGSRDMNWDSIESTALSKLAKKVAREEDPDMLLRIAAVANKAQRRTPAAGVLDPSRGSTHVPIQLSQKFVERINLDGSMVREETRQINTVGGRAVSPTFEDVDSLLKVSEQFQKKEKPTFAPFQRPTHQDDSF